MTLFFDHAGPLLRYDHGVLRIEDLNPEKKIRWRMTRMERLAVGFKFILSAILQK